MVGKSFDWSVTHYEKLLRSPVNKPFSRLELSGAEMSDCQARELILTGHFKSLLFNLNFLARLPKYMALLRFQNRMNIYLPLDL